jgi:hypothetical protein
MTTDNPYAPPTSLQGDSESDVLAIARRQLGRPATAIIIMASIHSVFDSIPLVNYAMMTFQGVRLYSGLGPILISALFFCVHVFQAVCGAKMGHLESRWMACAGAILATIPILSPFVFLGIPFGIWALVLLRKENIRTAFELARQQSG